MRCAGRANRTMDDDVEKWRHGQQHFCHSLGCPLHVTSDSPNVRGSGQWACIDGVFYDRHSIGGNGGQLYCSACRTRLNAEYEAAAARAALDRARAEPTVQTELFALDVAAPADER